MTLNPVVLTITTLAVVGSFFNTSPTRQGQADKRPFLIAGNDTSPHQGPLVATSYECAEVLKGSVVVILYRTSGSQSFSGYSGPMYVPAGYSIVNCPSSIGFGTGITGYVP